VRLAWLLLLRLQQTGLLLVLLAVQKSLLQQSGLTLQRHQEQLLQHLAQQLLLCWRS
jgi:hypothetical protein